VTDLQEREIDLASARMEAEAANRAKDRFLQNMSHELRTPLNAIIGFTDLMMHEPFGEIGHPNYREYLESIGESGRNLLNIIAQILDYVGAAGGTDRIAEEYFQVDEFIAGCITVARRDMRKRTLKIRTELDGCAGYVLNGDRSKLQVALGNLISNALKFSTDWESVMIDVRLTEDGGMVFSVLDKGCGISQEDVSRALVSFEQLEPHLVKRTSGIGLGLPLASRIMELHGGRLEIAQGTSGGTRASLVLPPERVVGQDGSVVSLPG
jgi:signal transduction histidine kinase